MQEGRWDQNWCADERGLQRHLANHPSIAGPQSAAAASYNYRHVNGEMDALGRLYIRFVIPFLCFFLDSDWDVGPGDNPN